MSKRLHIGSVSYLNAKPLIYGLEQAGDLELSLEVPAKLIDGLRDGRFDVALLPVIDYQRMDHLSLLTCGGIGCDGPTLTVRIFSKVPIEQMNMLGCDRESHTSVALARILLAETLGLHPEMVDLDRGKVQESKLLIGDKVVCEKHEGYPYQLDLGESWKRFTGLPFVFAAWVARAGVELGDLPNRLELAKREGLKRVEEIVAEHALPQGWPADLAIQYLTENLKFDIGEKQLEAIRLFHQLAAKHGIIPNPPRDLNVISG